VSLGTALAIEPEFYRFVIDALAELPGLVTVIAAGDAASELESGARRVIVRQSVPQLEVLERADAFLTHAGSNSMNEALWHGVPLLMFPLFGDHHENARRSVELGAGVRIERGITAERLRELVLSALDEASPWRAGARTIAESLRSASAEYGISGAASDVIDLVRRTK
jgi:MGT family glycosyltransferase